MSQKYIRRGWRYQEDIGITRDPNVQGGASVIAGTRIPISRMRNMHAEQIKAFWNVTDAQAEAAVRYWRIRQRAPAR